MLGEKRFIAHHLLERLTISGRLKLQRLVSLVKTPRKSFIALIFSVSDYKALFLFFQAFLIHTLERMEFSIKKQFLGCRFARQA